MKKLELRQLIKEELDKTNIAKFKEAIKGTLNNTAMPSFSSSGDTYSTKEPSILQMIKAIESIIQQYK
jgi:hypothetical protein